MTLLPCKPDDLANKSHNSRKFSEKRPSGTIGTTPFSDQERFSCH